MMITCIEDYDISYNLFLAEQDMFKDLASMGYSVVVNESVELVSLQEGVKETIMNYLQKVMTQIQKIWTKFQSKFSASVASFLEKKVVPLFDKADNAEFVINNYKQFDLSKLGSYNVAGFDYNDQTKESYKSGDALAKRLYPNLMSEGDLKKGLEKQIVSNVDKYKVTKKELLEIYEYCKDGYKQAVDQISKDIENLNNSSKTITNMVNSIISTQESLMLWDNMNLHIFTEGNEDEKMTFTDNSGETSGESKEADNSKAAITSAVTTYMNVSTKLLSAKMSMTTEKFNTCMRILTHFVEFYAKNKTAVVDNGKQTPTEAPTVTLKQKAQNFANSIRRK